MTVNMEHFTHQNDKVILSIVIPMYNEQENLDRLFDRVEGVVQSLTESYEIICIDDGSSDNTLAGLIVHRNRNPKIKVITFSRNFGKDIALTAGLDYTVGQAVVPLDADLQDPPEVIPALYAKWEEGYEVVYATRSSRLKDSFVKRFTAQMFYRVHNVIADVTIPEDTGDFRLMDRKVIEVIRQLPERNRFMKGVFAWVGFKQIGVRYARDERAAGTTKWQYWQLWNFAVDGLVSSSTVPLRIWSYIGATVAGFSFLYAVYLFSRTMIYGIDVPGYSSIMVTILFLGSVNIIATGILGEYIARISVEVRQRPLYLVREMIGIERRNANRQGNEQLALQDDVEALRKAKEQYEGLQEIILNKKARGRHKNG